MRSLFIILFSLFFVVGYSQPPGYVPKKGYPYFIKDAKNRIIGADIAGAFSALAADTTTEWLVQPPDTFQVFIISEGNPGDTSTLQNGVKAYYSFEEVGGVIAFDSAASYDGTLMNTPTQGETGISNLCYSFAYASSEWIDLDVTFWDFATSDFTVSFWVKTTAGGASGGIIGNWGGSPFWHIRLPSGGAKLLASVNFGAGNLAIGSNVNLSNDTWYHAVIRFDRDGLLTMHLDNVLQAGTLDISGSSAVDLGNANTFAIGRIGNHAAGYYHNGFIDELEIVDRLYSIDEISELYNQDVGKFWPFGGAGGDSLNMTISEYDTRADTFRILSKHESYPTNRTDGNLEFAFGIADIENYVDTTFTKVGPKDTTEYWAGFSGLIPEDTWTDPPNYDTVFRDSSAASPPIQDPGGLWDTIWSLNFEHHNVPIQYTSGQNNTPGPNLFSPDWLGATWRNSDYRWPSEWEELFQDSIIIDPLTGSKVLKFSESDTFLQGYYSNTSFRGGDNFQINMPDESVTEIYFSYNMMFKPGFLWELGGKLPGISGGTYVVEGKVPVYGEGFNSSLMFFHSDYPGSIVWYQYWQDQRNPTGGEYYPGTSILWEQFHPEGENLNYQGPREAFYFDVSAPIWYNITIRCVVNTFTGSTSDNNGILEGFINGKLVAQQTGLYLITYPDANTGKFKPFIRFFHGGSAPPAREEWLYLDDLITFTYGAEADVPRGNEPSPPGRVLNLPNCPKE